MRFKGRITQWKDDKGFGFIAPAEGGAQVFVHIKDLQRRARRPEVGDVVTYESVRASDGRVRATQVVFSGERPREAKPAATNTTVTVFAGLFLLAVLGLAVVGRLSFLVLAIYLVASLVAFGAYAWDKASAQAGRWRTTESTLLLMGLVGGWPGAAFAQQAFRHKSRKTSFQMNFWFTVIVNCAALGYMVYDGVEGSSQSWLFGR